MTPSTSNRIDILANQILLYKNLYYSGNSSIDDATFDALEDELRHLDPHNPVLSQVGYILSENIGKIAHEPAMLSLSKTYNIDDLFNFASKQRTVCTDKLDGMALAIEYDSSGNLMRASTRGNGKIGENVTDQIFYLTEIPKKINFPQKINKHTVEIRGEVYFPISSFSEFSERFDSYRNAVPGTFGRKDISEAAGVLRVLKFFAYDFLLKEESTKLPLNATEFSRILEISETSYIKKLDYLEKHGFNTGLKSGSTRILQIENQAQLGAFLEQTFAEERDYIIDGVVFRYDDEISWENLGNTTHHPRGSIAFKRTGETAVTEILAVEQSVGRSGKITFRARLAPVQLSGARISFASLHNAEFVESGKYAAGAFVKLKRSGEVIPSIIGLHQASETPVSIPDKCPCGYSLTRQGPDLFCFEKRPCPPKDQESLVYFAKVLDIQGVSDKIILRLRDAGLISEPADLFKLSWADLESLEGFGTKSSKNVISSISERCILPLSIFLTALGIKRGGAVKSKEVARKFKTLDAVLAASASEMRTERGWADKSAEDFFSSLDEKSVIIQNLLKHVTVLPDDTPELNEAAKAHPYFGKNICITGSLERPREEYKNRIERLGGKLVSSVSSKTDFLVCNDTSSTSKFKQAMVLKIPILTEVEFSDML